MNDACNARPGGGRCEVVRKAGYSCAHDHEPARVVVVVVVVARSERFTPTA